MRKKILLLGTVMTLTAFCLAGCGANNSVTDQATASPAAEDDMDRTNEPAVSPNGDDNSAVDDLGDGVEDAVDDAGNAVNDVIDGAEDAVDDVGDALDGDDSTNNTDNNQKNNKNTKHIRKRTRTKIQQKTDNGIRGSREGDGNFYASVPSSFTYKRHV